MATITLKNIPADLHRALKNRAEEHHRSLNGEILATLKSAIDERPLVDPVALIREAQAARKKFKRQVSAREIRTWIQRGRR